MVVYKEILESKPHDKRQLERYIKFIEHCRESNDADRNIGHHICPRAAEMFKEYECFRKNPWNKILLTERQHFIAHLILWKVYRNVSMTFALNMMRNFGGVTVTSRLYEELREDVSSIIGKSNKGRKRTKDVRDAIGKRTENTIIVFDCNDTDRNCFRINKDDEKYDPEIHLFYRTGYKHSEETKLKIGRPGKICCYNEETNTIKYVEDVDSIPDGFRIGGGPNQKISEYFSNSIWCYNPKTKHQIRIPENEIPNDYIRGRILENNPGIDKANAMMGVVDIIEQKATKTTVIDKTRHGPESGRSTEKTVVAVFNDKIFTNIKILVDFLHGNGYYITIERGNNTLNALNHMIIKKPHFNCKNEINEFRKKNQGKTLNDLGIFFYKLTDFDLKKHKGKEIYWKT
jgi:hypothetical protein